MRVSVAPAAELVRRLGLENTLEEMKFVHITGSKGKGSVGALVAAGLAGRAGVGVYGSPHVERINERIRVGGALVDDSVLGSVLEETLEARAAAPECADATWFDVMTVAALCAFRDARVDWAVVEVGMGGRLDSTNVLRAPVSVITNIALEHAEIIGPTLRDIAYEKAGIIAPDAHVVVGMADHHALAGVFLDEARAKQPAACVQFCPPQAAGTLRDHNVALARAALVAAAKVDGGETSCGEELLPDALADATLAALPGRQERFDISTESLASSPRAGGAGKDFPAVHVTLDGAHVPDSVARVLSELSSLGPPTVVLGLGREKDARGICNAVRHANPTHVFTTSAGSEVPYLPAEALSGVAADMGLRELTTSVSDATEALSMAVQLASEKGGPVLVIGSLHLAGRLRPTLRRLAARKCDGIATICV